MDCVLIQHGKAHQIWRATRKADLRTQYSAEILSSIVETVDGVVQAGDLWDGTAFSPSPTPDVVDLDTQAREATAPRVLRAWLLFYLRDKLGRQPTLAERQAAQNALSQAYKDVGP